MEMEPHFKNQIPNEDQCELHGKVINKNQITKRKDPLKDGIEILRQILEFEGITKFMSKSSVLTESIKLIEEIEDKITGLIFENNTLNLLLSNYQNST